MQNFVASRREWFGQLAGGLFGFFNTSHHPIASNKAALTPTIERQASYYYYYYYDGPCELEPGAITTFVYDSDDGHVEQSEDAR